MITIIVNKVGVIIPCSSPILRIINSIKQRAFISTPIVSYSRQFSSANLAASVQAIPLAKITIVTIKSVIAHNAGVLTKPIWVLSPENTKKIGNKKAVVNYSVRACICQANTPLGIAVAKINAPKTA